MNNPNHLCSLGAWAIDGGRMSSDGMMRSASGPPSPSFAAVTFLVVVIAVRIRFLEGVHIEHILFVVVPSVLAVFV